MIARAAVLALVTAWVSACLAPPGDDARGAAREFLAHQPRQLADCAARDRVIDTAQVPCELEDVGDVNGDGELDCWRITHADGAPQALAVWRSCRGVAQRFEVDREGMTLLAIPPELASPAWLHWLAVRMVGDGAESVMCAGTAIASCPAPSPAWRWVLASAARGDAQPGRHGVVEPLWAHVDPSTVMPTALIIPYVPDGWMQRLRGVEELEPESSLAGARIIVDALGPDGPPEFECGGAFVTSLHGGIGAWDRHHARFRWLWRGLPDYGGFAIAAMTCTDGVVIARTQTPFGEVAAIDVSTGGWLFEPSTDCCDGAQLWQNAARDPDARLLWQRDDSEIIRLATLGTWLHQPMSSRPALANIAEPRPELVDSAASEATYARDGELPELVAARDIASAARASLDSRLSCGSWQISWSATAILAERRGRARWLAVEEQRSTERFIDVTCAGGKVIAERSGSLSQFSDPRATEVSDELVVDLARGRSSVAPYPHP